MKTALKWIGIVLGVLIVLALLAAPLALRLVGGVGARAYRMGPGMMQQMPRNFNGNPGANPQQPAPRGFYGYQQMPRMHGGILGFGMLGMGGGLLGGVLHLLWNLLLVALIVAGIVFLVRAFSRPRAAPAAPAPAQPAVMAAPAPSAPVEAAPAPAEPPAVQTCAHCSRELQTAWAHCPYCGARIE